MRTFNISDSLKDSVINVLERRCIDYTLIENDSKIVVNVSGTYFHKVVLRAKMEKLTKEKHSEIPLIAKVEVDDKEVREEIGDSYIAVGQLLDFVTITNKSKQLLMYSA